MINELYNVFDELITSISMSANQHVEEFMAIYPYYTFLKSRNIEGHLNKTNKAYFNELGEYLDVTYKVFEDGGMLSDELSLEENDITKNAPQEFLDQDINDIFIQIVMSLVAIDFYIGNYGHAIECMWAINDVDSDINAGIVEILKGARTKGILVEHFVMLASLALDLEEKDRIKNKFIDIRGRAKHANYYRGNL